MHRTIFTAALAASLAITPAAFAQTTNFKADLKASSEVPPNDSKGTGTLNATYDSATKQLSWTVTYSGLTGPASAVHFHGPAEPGKNAGIVVPVTGNLASPMTGTATITGNQAADLEAGRWYFNIHTAAHPGGEIRGQVEKGK